MTKKKRAYHLENVLPATKPQVFIFPNGERITLYYVGLLAKLIGRTSYTIVAWERRGVIPPSGFKDAYNRRLYSMEQIQALLAVAEECKLGKGHWENFTLNGFSKKATLAWNEIAKKYDQKK